MSDNLNVRQTAAMLGIHENTVRNWADKGLLRPIKLPGSGFRRFSHADIQRMRDEMWSQFPSTTEMPEQRDDMPTDRVS